MLAVNTVITWKHNNETVITERIIWLNTNLDIAYVIDIDGDSLPIIRNISEINTGIRQGIVYNKVSDKYKRFINEDNLKEKDKIKRDNAWEVIKDLVILEPQIFDKGERRTFIKKAADLYKVHPNSIVKYLKKYWKRGMTKNALLPDFYNCGGIGKEKNAGEMKRGRKRRSKILDVGINIDDEVKKIFRVAINRYYYNSSKKPLPLTYEHMIKDFFSEDYRVDNGVKKQIIKTRNEIPTFNQFRYWFNKERNIKKEISTRISAKKYEQTARSIIGSSTKEALGPASIYQIDATIGDIYLTSAYNKNWIIRRPIIYNVMDVFSRMIVGIYVGLEGPSWAGAMSALANCASNKVEFCKEYDIDIKEEEWPIHYLPDSIIADRGEMEGKKVENLINGLGVKICNTKPYRGDMKAII